MAQVVHISLTSAMEEYAKIKVEVDGEYLNINELVRAAILQMIRMDYDYKSSSHRLTASAVGTFGGIVND